MTHPFFETTIRYLGGLIGAYELSGEKFLLEKAIDLGTRLLPSFNTPTGLPQSVVNLRSGRAHNHAWTDSSSILAELGSVQLEFKYLTAVSGDAKFADAAQRSMTSLKAKAKRKDGLFYVYYSPKDLSASSRGHITFGALGDSFYEYLLKQWLFTSKTEDMYLEMYTEAMAGLVKHLVKRSGPTNMTFVGELHHDSFVPEMDHLVCFVPGMLALGSQQRELPPDIARLHLDISKDLADTCVKLANNTKTGLSPESMRFFEHGKVPATDYQVQQTKYMLRPETIESLFYLYRFTGDVKYRRHGWRIFKNIEKWCKTESAFSGLVDVTRVPPEPNNSMQSFFGAETLKYLYLLFSDDETILPLDQYVFNTEAHPMKIHPRALGRTT